MKTSKKIDNTNWDNIRKNYSACEGQSYLISASVGALHKNTYKKISDHINKLYKYGDINWQDNLELINECRNNIASFLNTSSSEIAITPNTSHNMNLLAIAFKEISKKRTIITCNDEFPSTTLPWEHQKYNIKMIESKRSKININEIIESIDKDTLAVVISAIQFSTGFKIDLEELGKKLKKKNIYFIVNATQMIGQFPIDLNKSYISALTASCHKWLGAGFVGSLLYMPEEIRKIISPPMIGWFSMNNFFEMNNKITEIKSDMSAFETGIMPFSAIAGLNESIKVIQSIGIEKISKRILELSEYLYNELQKLNNLKILSFRDNIIEYNKTNNSGIISIKVENPEEIEEKLSAKKIFISPRRGSIRISVHFYNNKSDIDNLIKNLKEII